MNSTNVGSNKDHENKGGHRSTSTILYVNPKTQELEVPQGTALDKETLTKEDNGVQEIPVGNAVCNFDEKKKTASIKTEEDDKVLIVNIAEAVRLIDYIREKKDKEAALAEKVAVKEQVNSIAEQEK